MNTFVKLGLAAVLVVGGATATIAQNAAAGAKVDTTTTGSIGNFGQLISTLQTDTMADLSGWSDTATTNFVTVSSLLPGQGADPQALENALSKNQQKMAELHASIEANAALKAKIEAAGYTVNDVIAVETTADGSFTFYVDDRA